jgi:hypothetical protein
MLYTLEDDHTYIYIYVPRLKPIIYLIILSHSIPLIHYIPLYPIKLQYILLYSHSISWYPTILPFYPILNPCFSWIFPIKTSQDFRSHTLIWVSGIHRIGQDRGNGNRLLGTVCCGLHGENLVVWHPKQWWITMVYPWFSWEYHGNIMGK